MGDRIGTEARDREISFGEFPVIIMEDVNGSPFASEDQIRKTIAIEIAPDRAAHQADLLQSPGVWLIDFPMLRPPPIYRR